MNKNSIKLDGPIFDTYLTYCTCGWRSNLCSSDRSALRSAAQHFSQVHPEQKNPAVAALRYREEKYDTRLTNA